MLLETQHQPSSLKDFSHKTGMGNDEPQARLQAELPGMKAPLPSCTYINVLPYIERLMRREKATTPFGVKPHSATAPFLSLSTDLGNPTHI